MSRVLIVGVKEPAGGVERIVMSYVRNFSTGAVTADFAVFGDKLSFEDEITKRGGVVYYLPNRVASRKAYKKELDGIFADNRYDAVWCNFSGLTNIDFLKKAKKYGVGLRIAHAHTSGYFWGNPIMRYVVPVLHRINRVFLPLYANELWACSDNAAEFMFGRKYSKKAKKINNAIPADEFAFDPCLRTKMRGEFGFSENTLVVGHIGRMCTAKNQRFLLDIMKETVRLLPEAKLLFVGDGELYNEIINYAEEIGIKDSVVFTGVRKDVPSLLQAFDVFVLPSLSEGLPVVLIEAQAADVPCVASEGAVTKEANVSGNVLYVSLDESARCWAEKIISHSKEKPVNGVEAIKNSGYDIRTEAEKMEKKFTESGR